MKNDRGLEVEGGIGLDYIALRSRMILGVA